MADTARIGEIDAQIGVLRENLRELTEQAAARSGAGDEDLAAERIAKQEAQLEALVKLRATLAKA